ncbi:glutathione S-transferase family protein [Hoeflea prorocentri]|uniref:Glutathione S-transferase family protein n=1 Tax=Hoeflea prorocentri TaxID=1922333 RepID=A0A9X3ZIC1_9HYPH|nr:glutathione S-transferase family protein [Hoeflea prorocentri]MCY6381853.1 glutathione S-transferase family protein [Hoeflea prorocentri]MDA5399653.1 glutathione S-transferase family protein [Hoeflea prorocentri]
MIRVLGRKTSGNVQKVLFFLEETGTEYDREDFGRLFENTKTPEYLAMNPTAKVPTVIDGDTVTWESNTILRYLAVTRAPGLTGSNPAECAEVERWMDFLLAAINPGYLAAFKGAKLEPSERPAGFDAQLADLHAQMTIVSDTLDGNEFAALGKLTIADIAMAPIMGRCLNFPYQRPAMPGLEAWFERMSARDAFKAATG